MNAKKIIETAVYEIKVGKNTTHVKVVRIDRRVNGTLSFICESIKTGKSMTVSDADRFTKMIKPAKPSNATKTTDKKKSRTRDDGSMSAIEAAYKVLTETKRAMNAREIYETAVELGYCKLAGATPILTVSAILHLDIKNKGEASRFQKTGRGLFAAR